MRRSSLFLASATLFAAFSELGGCSSSTPAVGTGGSGGTAPALLPGEECQTLSAQSVKDFASVRAEPSQVFLPPCSGPTDPQCATRSLRIITDPDICVPTTVHYETSDPDIAPAPPDDTLGLHRSEVAVSMRAGTKAGTATITVHVQVPAEDANNNISFSDVTGTFQVVVLPGTALACTGSPAGPALLKGGGRVAGSGGSLQGASISLPVGADDPDTGSFLWGVTPFEAQVSCGPAAGILPKTPGGAAYLALGPAITFGPVDASFQREVPLSIPINPALLPSAARWRHLRIAYSGPSFRAPRTIPVADPRVELVGGQWAVTFKAPRLGTYQAVVAPDAGAKSFPRRITHRAVVGISMGGGGTASFGMRHHDLFDVIAPLGGPVDWTWMLHYIERNHLGGFRPIAPGTPAEKVPLAEASCTRKADCKADETCLGIVPPMPGKCVLLPAPENPYEHPQTFNTWWYEYPSTGNGGHFSRQEYAQIFRDLAIMFGNPNGANLSPDGENLPAGVNPHDQSVTGDHPYGQCNIWVDPIDTDPTYAAEQALANTCPVERCAHTLTLKNYYDAAYNPDGKFDVITVCDGGSQYPQLTPYANTWFPTGNNFPLEVGLAVDVNGNGQREELEPVIRAGHEPWQDTGIDGIPSDKEPGYQKGVNDDPNGDDYNAQYNPTGTEGDFRLEPGEPFSDVGLDGVPHTKQQPKGGWQKPGDGYDVGEGDGKFTVAPGLQRFWDRDAHSIIRRTTASVPGGDLTDDALARIDLWTDGGLRDLFNFDVDAQHLIGALVARNRDAAYFTNFADVPGNDPTQANQFDPGHTVYGDLQGVVLQRYGALDPTPADLSDGSGQHVGTAGEIASRLQSALYFIGSRWTEPELRQLDALPLDDAHTVYPPGCSKDQWPQCTINFTSKGGRTGPVGISFPPGYTNIDLQTHRYPVIYLLHGYGQTPQDLEPALVFLGNWMNSDTVSAGSRMPKAIIVYVDGRCRIGPSGKAECIRGTFFADSPKATGAQDETWWLELMSYMDKTYRTMGETSIDWTP